VRRRRKTGRGDSDRFAAGNMAADYLALCQNPLKDLKRWAAEDKKNPLLRWRSYRSTAGGEKNYEHTTTQTGLEHAHGLRRKSLPPVRGWMDTDQHRGRRSHRVLARPRTGSSRYGELQSLRGEGTGITSNLDDANAERLSSRASRSAIGMLYAVKIEATRRSLPRREIAAAIRAICDDRRAALRAIGERQQARMRYLGDRRARERLNARLARRDANAPPEIRPQ